MDHREAGGGREAGHDVVETLRAEEAGEAHLGVARLLSLDVLLEVEVKGVFKVGEDGQVGVLAQVQD